MQLRLSPSNFLGRGTGAMTQSWEDCLKKVEVPFPGDAVIKATATFFNDKLQIKHPALAEGYAEDQIAARFRAELPVQACIKRALRAVEAVAQSRRMAQATGTATTAASVPATSAHNLAKLLAASSY